MIKKLTKSYEFITKKSIEEILSEIKLKSESKKSIGNFLTSENINYKDFIISDKKIEIERWPSIFNPFRGSGIITFELNKSIEGTKIKCNYGPIKLGIYMGLGLMAFVFIALFIVLLISPFDSYLKEIFAIFIFLILPFGLIMLISYLFLLFNTNQLEKYLRSILKDIRLIDY